ncbi:ATP-dependent protease, partial [Candidatus Bipolaricaulota bacterium]|nr:ATP-dependent protease [Candidatus Bipolaricaulota bacterium]
IPVQNVDNLMLSEEVVEAVDKGEFHIYPVSTVEEGIEILTGIPAGTLKADGTFPEGTVFARIATRLEQIRKVLKEEAEKEEEKEKSA